MENIGRKAESTHYYRLNALGKPRAAPAAFSNYTMAEKRPTRHLGNFYAIDTFSYYYNINS